LLTAAKRAELSCAERNSQINSGKTMEIALKKMNCMQMRCKEVVCRGFWGVLGGSGARRLSGRARQPQNKTTSQPANNQQQQWLERCVHRRVFPGLGDLGCEGGFRGFRGACGPNQALKWHLQRGSRCSATPPAERNKFSMENFVHLIFTSFNDILMCVENANRKTTFPPHSLHFRSGK